MITLRPIGNFPISQTETPESLRLRLMPSLGNFTWTIQEAQTGRFIPDTETLVDGREYFANFNYDLPPDPRFHEDLVSPSKTERIGN
jgi:hypothetical protein